MRIRLIEILDIEEGMGGGGVVEVMFFMRVGNMSWPMGQILPL